MRMTEVTIHSDGASRGNGRADSIGAYGAVVNIEGKIREVSKAYRGVTNNQMELRGALAGLKVLDHMLSCDVTIYSDSKYVCDAFNKGWIPSWKSKGWVTSKKTPVLNRDIWEELVSHVEKHKVSFVWVKGHDTNKGNIRADELCNIAMDEFIPSNEEVAITKANNENANTRESLIVEIELIKKSIESMTKLYDIKMKQLSEV